MANQEIGKKGELLAGKFLRENGYRILDTNYHYLSGEVDIIAQDRDRLVFIEVKYRNSDAYGSPLEAVTLRKQRKIAKGALYYMSDHNLFDQPCRFDVVSIDKDNEGKMQIEIIKNAFELEGSLS